MKRGFSSSSMWQWRRIGSCSTGYRPHCRGVSYPSHWRLIALTSYATDELAGEASEDGPHPAEGLGDVGLGVGVREAKIALAVLAERGAAQHGDAPVLEDGFCDLAGRLAQRLDVGEHVEGALGRAAAHTRQGVEPRHDEVAPALELRDHLAHGQLVALQRGDARPLREGGGAR